MVELLRPQKTQKMIVIPSPARPRFWSATISLHVIPNGFLNPECIKHALNLACQTFLIWFTITLSKIIQKI